MFDSEAAGWAVDVGIQVGSRSVHLLLRLEQGVGAVRHHVCSSVVSVACLGR